MHVALRLAAYKLLLLAPVSMHHVRHTLPARIRCNRLFSSHLHLAARLPLFITAERRKRCTRRSLQQTLPLHPLRNATVLFCACQSKLLSLLTNGMFTLSICRGQHARRWLCRPGLRRRTLSCLPSSSSLEPTGAWCQTSCPLPPRFWACTGGPTPARRTSARTWCEAASSYLKMSWD